MAKAKEGRRQLKFGIKRWIYKHDYLKCRWDGFGRANWRWIGFHGDVVAMEKHCCVYEDDDRVVKGHICHTFSGILKKSRFWLKTHQTGVCDTLCTEKFNLCKSLP